eukprot:4884791-Prymnesium_polylepis.1
MTRRCVRPVFAKLWRSAALDVHCHPHVLRVSMSMCRGVHACAALWAPAKQDGDNVYVSLLCFVCSSSCGVWRERKRVFCFSREIRRVGRAAAGLTVRDPVPERCADAEVCSPGCRCAKGCPGNRNREMI